MFCSSSQDVPAYCIAMIHFSLVLFF
uniref:Uncharacterized protein n=1 Tax=Arundo donax TaxID=35708 RepID=A0A0A9FBM3_ARUDO